jgi:V8-like Glu-specific endopeptidase
MSPSGVIEGLCFLRMNRKYVAFFDQIAISTGVLLDRRYVVTAGHNLFNASYPWGRIKNIEIAVGREDISGMTLDEFDGQVSGGKVEEGAIPSDGIWTVAPKFHWSPSTWLKPSVSNQMIQHDYGFIDMGKDFQGQSVFTLGGSGEAELKVGDLVKVAGYPGDPRRVSGATGERLYYAEGRVTKIKENLFSYSVITAKGLSGAPVWVEKGRKKIIVGVHVGSDFGDEKGAVARIVDSTFIHDWNRWKGRRETAN